jgi:hypothetical protein
MKKIIPQASLDFRTFSSSPVHFQNNENSYKLTNSDTSGTIRPISMDHT